MFASLQTGLKISPFLRKRLVQWRYFFLLLLTKRSNGRDWKKKASCFPFNLRIVVYAIFLTEFLLLIFVVTNTIIKRGIPLSWKERLRIFQQQRSKHPSKGPNVSPRKHLLLVNKHTAKNDRSVMVFVAVKEQFPKTTKCRRLNMAEFYLRETRHRELYKSQTSSVDLCVRNGEITLAMVWNFSHFR